MLHMLLELSRVHNHGGLDHTLTQRSRSNRARVVVTGDIKSKAEACWEESRQQRG